MWRPSTVVLGFLILALNAFSQTETVQSPSLVRNSPFLPPGFQPPGSNGSTSEPPAVSDTQFEFRGVYQLGGRYYFNLYNIRDRQGSWMSEADAADQNVRIISFDEEENRLVLNVGGEQTSLSLIQASNSPMPIQTAARPQVQPASPGAPSTEARTPVRRRVIRPSVRTSSNNAAAAAARRRVINRTSSNR